MALTSLRTRSGSQDRHGRPNENSTQPDCRRCQIPRLKPMKSLYVSPPFPAIPRLDAPLPPNGPIHSPSIFYSSSLSLSNCRSTLKFQFIQTDTRRVKARDRHPDSAEAMFASFIEFYLLCLVNPDVFEHVSFQLSPWLP
jgi:hypothetical protein